MEERGWRKAEQEAKRRLDVAWDFKQAAEEAYRCGRYVEAKCLAKAARLIVEESVGKGKRRG